MAINREMDKGEWYIYIVDYYSTIKKNRIVSFTEMWMDLETVKQSELRKRKTSHISTEKRGYVYMFSWFTLLLNRNWHSSLKELNSNKKYSSLNLCTCFKFKKKKKRKGIEPHTVNPKHILHFIVNMYDDLALTC